MVGILCVFELRVFEEVKGLGVVLEECPCYARLPPSGLSLVISAVLGRGLKYLNSSVGCLTAWRLGFGSFKETDC